VFSVAVLLALTASAADAESCFELDLPLLFDTSGNPTHSMDNPRAHGLDLMTWGGSGYLVLNTGNDLRLIEFSDPATPGVAVDSDFGVPPYGDIDYNLYRFSVCAGCRFGTADFARAGAVLFDLGSGPEPAFGPFALYTTAGVGRFTFRHDGQQYLVANGFGATCGSFASLHEFNGTGLANLPFLDCFSGPAGGQFRPLGGAYVPGAGGEAFLYLSDGLASIHVFRLVDGATLGVEYLGAPIFGSQLRGEGWAIDLEAGLFAGVVFGQVRLYDITTPSTPRLVSEWDVSDLLPGANLVAMRSPQLWLGRTTLNNARTYDIGDPSAPAEIDRGVWSTCHPWNSIDYSRAEDAEFTPDGQWLLLSRFSVVERFRADPSCPGLVFSDGFECGTSFPWSLEYPGAGP
jgi:hypothetical protein